MTIQNAQAPVNYGEYNGHLRDDWKRAHGIWAGIRAALFGYGARAYPSADQDNLTNNAYTKVVLGAESFDPGAHFDHVTNSRYTAAVSGYYSVKAHIYYHDLPTTGSYSIHCIIYKNGALYSYNALVAVANSFGEAGVGHADDIYLAAGDYVELYAYQYTSTNTVDITGDSTKTFLAVQLLSLT